MSPWPAPRVALTCSLRPLLGTPIATVPSPRRRRGPLSPWHPSSSPMPPGFPSHERVRDPIVPRWSCGPATLSRLTASRASRRPAFLMYSLYHGSSVMTMSTGAPLLFLSYRGRTWPSCSPRSMLDRRPQRCPSSSSLVSACAPCGLALVRSSLGATLSVLVWLHHMQLRLTLSLLYAAFPMWLRP